MASTTCCSSATAPSRSSRSTARRSCNALNAQTLDELRRAMLELEARRARPRRDPDRRGREGVRRRRRHQRARRADADERPRARARRPARLRPDRDTWASRSSRRSTATRSAAAASWRWRARSASRPTPRSSVSRRSTSGSFPATPARSGCRGWSARAGRWSCMLTGAPISARRGASGSAWSTASCRRPS